MLKSLAGFSVRGFLSLYSLVYPVEFYDRITFFEFRLPDSFWTYVALIKNLVSFVNLTLSV